MKKVKLILLTIVIMLIVCSVLFACSQEDENVNAEIVDINVKFYIGETLYKEGTYKTNDIIEMPDIKTYNGLTINYWSLNNNVIFSSYTAGQEDLVFIANATKTIEVSFISDGETVAKYYPNHDAKISSNLENPTKTGYTFKYWTLNNEKVNFPLDLSNYSNFEKLDIVAFFEKNIDISFIADDTVYKVSNITKNTQVARPTNPNKDGHSFIYWIDNNGNKVDFSKTLNEDTSYFAVFEKDFYRVNYYVGNTLYDTLYTNDYALDINCENTEFFYGWYANSSLTTPFNFENKLTKNINLYAKTITTKYDVIYKQIGSSYIYTIPQEYMNKFNASYAFDGYRNTFSLTLNQAAKSLVAKYNFKRSNNKTIYISFDLINGIAEATYGSAAEAGSYSYVKLKFDAYNYGLMDYSFYQILNVNEGAFVEDLKGMLEDIATMTYNYVQGQYDAYIAGYDSTIVRETMPTCSSTFTYEYNSTNLVVSSTDNYYSVKLIKDNDVVSYDTNNKNIIFDLEEGDYTLVVIYEYSVQDRVYREVISKKIVI